MKNTILFSLIFMCFCTITPLSIALTGCNKVEAVNPIEMTWQDSVILIGNKPYMMTLEGTIPILKVEDAHATYSYFMDIVKQNHTESPKIWMADWQDSSHVIVEFRNKFYYHTHQSVNAILQGILISESDYPIYVCERENLFVGEEYNLNLANISEPLQTYCRTLTDFEAHIFPTENPSEFKIWFGGWDSKKEEFTFFKSFIIIT